MSTKGKVRIINDIPASSDAFGPHKKVAEAIYDVIQTEFGNKAISLEGSWGSGKSTVIKLLNSMIKKDSETIYVFDAWSHEGDPLRRSFLEGIIEHLEKIGWARKGEWEEAKLDISRRREETESRTSSSLTPFGKGLAFSALIAPLGLALVSKNGLFLDNAENFFVSLAPLILSLSPLWIGIFTWISLRKSWMFWQKDFWVKAKYPYTDESFFSVFVNTNTEVHKSVTSKTADPTSIEFNSLFCQILDRILSENNRKLIIVMDNLDRVTPDAAINIWSTMRVFFDDHRSSKSDIVDRFWLIVPFDSGAIKSLWNKTDEEGLTVENAESFISKSFQLSFHVSSPVLSDWKEFLLGLLAEAFPEHPKEEFHAVYRLYLLSSSQTSPRELKKFVNSIGEIYRQWGLKIPFIVQTAYVLNRKNSKNIEKSIADGTFLSLSFQTVIGLPDWQKFISALHFNVEIDKALQVLLRTDVEKSFAEGKSSLLVEMKKLPGFELVCEDLIVENASSWAKDEPATLGLSAKVLFELDITESISASKSWDALRTGCYEVSYWKGVTPDSVSGLLNILKMAVPQEQNKLSSKLLSGFTAIPVGSGKDAVQLAPAEWSKSTTETIGKLADYVLEFEGGSELIEKNLKVPGDANAYIDFLFKLGNKRPRKDVFIYFKNKSKPEEISTVLVGLINSGALTSQHYEVFKSLVIIGYKKWNEIATAIEARLNPGNSLNGIQSIGLIRSLAHLHFVAKEKTANTSIANCVSQGKITHFLHQFEAEKSDQGRGLGVLLLLFFNPLASSIQNQSNSNSGVALYNAIRQTPMNYKSLVKAIADEALEFDLINEFLNLLSNSNIKDLVKAVIQNILVERSASSYVDSEFFLEKYEKVLEGVEWKNLQTVVNDLIENDDLIEKIVLIPFNSNFKAAYYYISLTEAGKKSMAFVDFSRIGLKSLTEEQWSKEIEDDGDLLDVAVQLSSAGNSLNLEDNFVDAYSKKTLKLRQGEELSEYLLKQWPKLINAADESFKVTFYRDVVSDLIRNPSFTNDHLFNALGDGFYASEAIDENADEFFRIVGKEILDRNEVLAAEVNGLSKIIELNPDVKSKIKEPSKTVLRKRIGTLQEKEQLEDVSVALRKLLNDLA